MVKQYYYKVIRVSCKKTKNTARQYIFPTVIVATTPVIVSLFLGSHFDEDAVMQQWMISIVGLCLTAAFFAGVFFNNLVKAPVELESDMVDTYANDKLHLQALEEERIPKIIAKPITGKRANYESNKNTCWAELKITNTSPSVPLMNVTVQIVELVQVYERQNEEGESMGVYSTHEPYPNWSPSNVYWSERNTLTHQLTLDISPNESKCAMVAFHGDNKPALGVLNTPTYPIMLESKIVIEVTSPDSSRWREAYYIEYHSPSTDEFEFIAWDEWLTNHTLIMESRTG